MKKILIGMLGMLTLIVGINIGDGMAQTTYTISGYVRDSGGGGILGVTMAGLPGNPTTDSTGNYSGAVPSNWSGIVKPEKIGYAIFPFSTEYTNVATNQTQDYSAVLLPKVALFMEPTTYNLGDPINVVMTLQNQGNDFFTSQGFMATNFALLLQFIDPDLKLITSNFGIGRTPLPPAVVPITTAEDKVELLQVEYVENVPANWVLSMPFNVLDYYTLTKGGNYSVKAKFNVRAYLPDSVSQTDPKYGQHDSGSSGDVESNIVSFAIISSSTLDHITINPTSSTIIAGGSQTYATRAFDVYNSSIDVTAQTLFTITNGSCSGNTCTALAAGLHTVTATYSGKIATATLQVNPGVPNKLVFSGQPSDAAVGVTISPPITVQILDSNGNLTSSTAPVTLAIGNNPGGGTLSRTKTRTRNAINGVATFNDLSINKVGNGYTLVASSSGLTGATSSAFNITIKTHFLIVTKVGIGSGNVTASPGTLIWNGIIGTATYNHNTTVTLTATPDAGSTFNGWYAFCLGAEGCSVTINGSKCTLKMCGPCFANATFMLKTYTITATAGTGGSISPSGSVKVNHGANKTFTITPNTGYQIADVKVDNVSKGAITTYTFTNVTAKHTISATFKATTPTTAVRPMLECVRNNGNGTYTAYFGYLNENTVAVTITVGSNNKFTPNPQNRGQPTGFEPGRTENAFSVVFDGNDLVWYLKGPDGQGRTATASRNSSRCKEWKVKEVIEKSN